jgi:hypothetical protein
MGEAAFIRRLHRFAQIGRNVVRDLIEERAPCVLERLTGEWQTHYAFFSRAGSTDAVKEEAAKVTAAMSPWRSWIGSCSRLPVPCPVGAVVF